MVHGGLGRSERRWFLKDEISVQADDVVNRAAGLDAGEQAHGLLAVVGLADVEPLVNAGDERARLGVDREAGAVDRS